MITHRQRAGLTRAGTAISLIGALCMVAAVAVSPASASGEFTTASLTSPLAGSATTFQWTYVFNQGNGHGLSNIAVRFCSSSIISHIVSAGPDADTFETGDVPGGHTGFGPGVKFELTAARGTFEITFDQPFSVSAVGLEVQSHSGNGQLGDIITTAGGPDSGCEPAATTTTVPTTTTAPPTTTTTVPPTTTTVPSTTTTVGPTTTTTTPPPTTTTVPATTTTLPEDPPTIPGTLPTTTIVPPATTTVPPATTTTLRVTTTTVPVPTSTTVPGRTTTTTVAPTTTTAPVPSTLPTRVLGESAVDPGDPGDPVVAARAELAKTGASSLGLLLAAGLALLLLGAVLIGIGRASEVLGSDG